MAIFVVLTAPVEVVAVVVEVLIVVVAAPAVAADGFEGESAQYASGRTWSERKRAVLSAETGDSRQTIRISVFEKDWMDSSGAAGDGKDGDASKWENWRVHD